MSARSSTRRLISWVSSRWRQPPTRVLTSIGVLIGSASSLERAHSLAEPAPALSHAAWPGASTLSIKELKEGSGTAAELGTWASVHYEVRLVGDGTLVESTKSSGYGDRTYGEPLLFEVGNLRDAQVLRSLHATVLDMRVGGVRRVRTCLKQAEFGYRELPEVIERHEGGLVRRPLHGDWLMDVTIHLIAVDSQRPGSAVWQAVDQLRANLTATLIALCK